MPYEKNHNFVFDLLYETEAEDLNYIYRGEFNKDITNYILSLAEKNIIESKIQSKTKKRVFHIMVESIQNINRHQDYSDEEYTNTSFFAIQKNGTFFYITTANVIDNSEIPSLKDKLDRLNQLSDLELTKTYLQILNDGQISSKGGAGLGLIEIVRKSKNKLYYQFEELSETKSFIYMHSYIDTLPQESLKRTRKIYTFDYIIKLHKQVLKENILLMYSNLFEQSSLVRLISILKSQKYSALAFKKRIISAMIELLQNIILHGKIELNGKLYSPGIFYISKEDENIYYLNSVNYITKEKIKELKEKLNFLNNSLEKEIDEYYNKQLFNFSQNDKNAGLGLIELRLRSKNKLEYSFNKFNEELSLFLLTIKLIDD